MNFTRHGKYIVFKIMLALFLYRMRRVYFVEDALCTDHGYLASTTKITWLVANGVLVLQLGAKGYGSISHRMIVYA